MPNALVDRHQPTPKPSRGDCWQLVLRDMQDRRAHGIEKHGTPLQPFNGRDVLVDLYQEQLDAIVYTRQALAERAVVRERLARVRSAVEPHASADTLADLDSVLAYLGQG